MQLSYKIIKDLYLLNRNFCSSDYDKALDYISKEVDGKIIQYEQQESNGWVTPPKWDLEEAYIEKNGEKIYDATQHPLQVISMSAPFEGVVSLDELKKHLHYQTNYQFDSSAIPFHFRQNYQSWNRDWGIAVSEDFFNQLTEGDYKVVIRTKESQGHLKIFEAIKKGSSDITFYFVAHLDHPGMANDDLAGCAVGLELFKKLESLNTKYTYKLLIVPEIIGSEYYLGALNKKENIGGSLFLEMLGSNTELAIQKSFRKNSIITPLLKNILEKKNISFNEGDYGTIIGNDEIVFEAYNIPMPSLSRYPYPQYHTDKDNMDIISEEALSQSVAILDDLVKTIDAQIFIRKKFEGVICLSNPNYDLYVDLGARGELATDEKRKLRLLMDYIAFMEQTTTIIHLTEKFDLNEETVLTYLKKWEDKGLIELI